MRFNHNLYQRFGTAFTTFALLVGSIIGVSSAVADESENASPYQVVWDSASPDWGGSVPLGNGEVALNAWFEDCARVQLLFARTDSWDDYGRLAKVGSVEISFLGDAFVPELATPFKQTLDTETGTASVVFGPEGKETRVRLWVETNRDNVVVEVDSDLEIAPRARLRFWRFGQGEVINSAETSDLWWAGKDTEKIRVFTDSALESPELKASNRVCAYHRNVKTKYFDEIAKTQGFEDFPNHDDPYVNRTFGVLLSGDDATWEDSERLVAKPGKTRRFEIAVHSAQTETLDEWVDQIVKIADDAASVSIDKRRAETLKYWREFTERSWVRFSPNQKAIAELSDEERAAVAAETFDVTRAYALQRYVFACEGRGNYPIKFNGGLFTVATPGKPASHDYRRWGPGYWFQNTRLPYYSMLASGDFDEMEPFFKMYCGLVPTYRLRTQKYFGIDGVYFPECIYFTGEVFPETYGLQPWNERQDKLQTSGYHKWEWVGGLEVCLAAVKYYEHTLDEDFLQTKAIPTTNAVLRFFDGYYKTDAASGKLKMSPAQALETWWDCDDPAPEVAGIRAVLEHLLALPESKTTEADRAFWMEMLAKTPEVPTVIDKETGEKKLAPAARFDHRGNIETPELYPVFPFRLFSFEKPNADWAKRAYETRLNKYSTGWAQDDLFCAYLGDAEGAKNHLVVRSRATDKSSRFPAFYGPNWDWTPDQCHGGVLTTAAQALAMQTDGDAIFVTPALPKTWDVDFKLWAPKKTIVRGRIVDGEVAELNVEPKEREADVKIIGR